MTAPIRGASLTTAADIRATLESMARQQRFHVLTKTFAGGGLLNATVLFDREYYLVKPSELEALRSGATPESLGLEPYEPEDE